MYPKLVYIFNSNLSFSNNIIHFRVKILDFDISLEGFTTNFHLSYEDEDIFNLDFDGFEFPDSESALTAS